MNVPSDRLNRVDRAITAFMGKYAIPCLRVALGITYIWFGALKIFGVSPVADLVRKTSLFLPNRLVVQLVGTWEVAVGTGLLFRVALRPTLLLFFLQMLSTFMVLIVRPREAFRDGNPLLLTERGEFIVKNLVFLAAGIAIGSTARRKSEKIDASTGQVAP